MVSTGSDITLADTRRQRCAPFSCRSAWPATHSPARTTVSRTTIVQPRCANTCSSLWMAMGSGAGYGPKACGSRLFSRIEN
jgi:hypothetical protein